MWLHVLYNDFNQDVTTLLSITKIALNDNLLKEIQEYFSLQNINKIELNIETMIFNRHYFTVY